jgi:hypothetical protein
MSETAIVAAGEVRALVPGELLAGAQKSIQAFRAIIEKSTVEIPSKGGPASKHLRVEGWASIAQGMGAEITIPTITVLPDGSVEAVCRLVIGEKVYEGRGWVGMDEKRWGSAPMYARRAMAQTRAIGRACRHGLSWVRVLLGDNYSGTPAEEMEGMAEHNAPPRQPAPPKPTPAQWKRIGVLMDEVGITTAEMEKLYGRGEDMTPAKADAAITDLEKRKAAKAGARG